MLKIKWTDRLTNDKVFRGLKEKRILLKILQNRRHSWTGHTVRHSEFVVNIFEGEIFGKKSAVGRPGLRYLSKWPETHQLTVVQQWQEGLATVAGGKLQTDQKIEG
jgi:hypothetical protein